LVEAKGVDLAFIAAGWRIAIGFIGRFNGSHRRQRRRPQCSGCFPAAEENNASRRSTKSIARVQVEPA